MIRLSAALETYVEEYTSPVPPLLSELERETRTVTDAHRMLTGRVEARLLQILVRVSGSRRVIEVGTFTGYSALMMAEGLPDDGILHTCEISRKYASIALRYFRKSPHGRKIRLRIGPAIDTLSKFPDNSMDFVFIDADKPSYPAYYDEGLRLLKRGGLIAVDNTLWSGKVLEPADRDSRAIALFNKKVKKDRRVEKVMLTIRDGVYLIRKK